MDKSRLLIIEPFEATKEKIKKLFIDEDLDVVATSSTKDALAKMEQEHFDIVISELKTEDGSILDISKMVKESLLDTYLLLWTKETDVSVLYQCYKAGIDSINSKARPPILVKAKIMAMLRRIENWRTACATPLTVNLGIIKMDKEARRVYIKEKYVKTTTTEYKIFAYLMEKVGTVVSKEELIENIWVDKSDRRNIDVYIHRLRARVGDIITTKRKQGYLIERSSIEEK